MEQVHGCVMQACQKIEPCKVVYGLVNFCGFVD